MRTECRRGHKLVGENVRVDPKSGYLVCRTCNRDRVREFYIRKGDWNPYREKKGPPPA